MSSSPWVLYGPQQTGTTGPRRQPRRPAAPKPKLPPKPHPPVRQHVNDPFAPRSDAQLQSLAGSMVQSQLAPIIKQIQDAIAARSVSGQQAIGGLTQSLGGLFAQAAPQTQAAFSEAQGAQSSTNNALADRLGSFGKGLSAEQGQTLASINAPSSVGNVAANTGNIGQGAANAGFAVGNAELGALTAHGANAGAYAAQLPGIAGLTGIQNSKLLQAQLNSELADQTGRVSAQAPGLIQQIYDHLVDQELQKAVYKQSGLVKDKQFAADQAYRAAQLDYKNRTAAWQRSATLARLGISAAAVRERARHDGISESQAAAKLVQAAKRAGETARHNHATETTAAKNAATARYNSRHRSSKSKGSALDGWKPSKGK
jgi:hypothetical protein